MTAAAASVKRREPSADLEIPPEKPVKDAPVLPVGFNGSDSITAPAQDAEKPQPAAKEPAAGKDAAEGMKEADAKTAVEAAPKPEKVPDAAADAKSEATSATDANAASDKPADANSEGRVSDETPVTEPVEAAESEKIESAGKTGEAGAGESPGMTQLKDAAAAAAETGSADNAVEDGIEVALADALSPAQGQPTNLPDASAEAAASTLLEAVKIDVEMASPVSDTATGTQATTEAAAAEPPSPAKSFEEIMAEHAPGDGLDIAAPPQTDTTVAPVPEAAPTPGDAKAEAAGQTVDPSPQRPAAISPFPTIPEDVRRSVLEAARRAEGSLDADPAMTDGGTKTTLGDLAERLEQALAEQASTLSGQLKPNADTKPAASHAPADSAQNPAASIEAWESGELVSSGPPAADSEAGAAASLAEQSGAGDDAEPRQSQAMLEDETDSGVIDFSDRKKASPEDAPSDSLEDEMARLLGELTGGKSAG
ncbi:MAG TPA: hypothetical protein VLA28_01000 [Afifellaceae bacterium]|nr:hypothetical protein [Afifellaceae bacterium]